MKRTATIVALAMAGMLLGCQDQEYAVEIREAREALVTGFPELADHHLDQAEALANEARVRSTVDGELLRAELKLQQGQFEAAARLAGKVATEAVPGSVNSARANEVLAKAAIRQGNLGSAEEHLLRAQQSYRASADQLRVKDLLNMTQGLSAYSEGDITLARKHWDQISSEQLRLDVRTITRTTSRTVVLQ